MVRVHGQEVERITGDPIVERFDTSGFQGVGRHKVALFFGGGGGGGDSGPTIEEQQQQQFAEARDKEYNKTFNTVAKPWLNKLKKDTFSQADRAAAVAGRGNADIEQQAEVTRRQGLQAALKSGADISNATPVFTDPAATVTDAKQGLHSAAQKAGAESRMQDIMDGVRLGQDNMQVTGNNLSALTSFSTDNKVDDIQKAGADAAGKWDAVAKGVNMAGQVYGSSLNEDIENQQLAQANAPRVGPPPPAKSTWAGTVDRGLRKVSNLSAWGF